MRLAMLGVAVVGIGCVPGPKPSDTADSGTTPDNTSTAEVPWATALIVGTDDGTTTTTLLAVQLLEPRPGPGIAPERPLDVCTPWVDGTPTPSSSTPAALDAGVVTVELDGVPVPIDPVLGFALLDRWPVGESLSFSATGGADVPAFDQRDLLVVSEATAPAGFTLAPDGSLAVTWTGTSADPDTFVDVIAVDAEDGVGCAVTDDGAFDVPASGFVPTLASVWRHRYAVVADDGVVVGAGSSFTSFFGEP